MIPTPLTRRHFLATTSAGLAATLLPISADAADRKKPPVTRWPIGCLNRPWRDWGYDAALDGIKAAGYEWTGLLTALPGEGEVFTGSGATPEYLDGLKRKIAARGLKVNMCALRLKNTLALPDVIADTRRQIANAHTLGLEYALTFGESKPERYAQFYRVMADIAAFAHERGIKLVMKPHGGGSGSSREILESIKSVGHRNFKIWYDAGNIVFYTGKDPVAELEPIVEHVTGLCAKDCDKQRGEVMIQLGTGRVDFAGVFKKFKSAGFNGPIMLEGCQVGATAQATTENARANRVFLQKVLASI